MNNKEDLSVFSDVSSDMSNIIDKNKIINGKSSRLSVDKNNNESINETSCTRTIKNSISSGSSSSSSGSSSGSSSSGSSSGSSSSGSSSSVKDMELLNKIYIDVAVIHEEYNKIEVTTDYHIIDLDEICVSMELFQMMFYPYKEQFGINRDFFKTNSLISLISFSGDFRTKNGKKFYLLEELLGNIESDLCISRNCFTKDSLVELTNEITIIKSILDIKCCSVLSSLTWSNILDIINNYKSIKDHCKTIPILIINIVFHTPTPGVKDTIIRFMYKIN
jgi:hypothetical protein